jgi:hypothetical protein
VSSARFGRYRFVEVIAAVGLKMTGRNAHRSEALSEQLATTVHQGENVATLSDGNDGVQPIGCSADWWCEMRHQW